MHIPTLKHIYVICVAFTLTLSLFAASASIMARDSNMKPSKEASKALKQAERLASKPEKASDARKLITTATADSVLSGSAKTYAVAAKIELGVYNDAMRRLSINRNDPKVDKVAMADALLATRRYYQLAMEHDTTVDSKGKVTVRYSEPMAEWLAAQVPQYYNAGIAYLNKKQYYPKAYDAFMAFAGAPDERWYDAEAAEVNDSARAKGYFYAGVMAYNAQQYKISADAFKLARHFKYPRKEVLLNEMVCYRKLSDADTTLLPEAMRNITRIAGEGVERFGIEPPMFIQKYVAGCIWEKQPRKAIAVLDSLVPLNPASAGMLLSLRADAHLAAADTIAAINDLTAASADSSASFATLLMTSKLYARKGISELSANHGTGREAKRNRKKIIDTWLSPALAYAERASILATKREDESDDDSDQQVVTPELLHDLDNTIATIHYYKLH